MSRILLWMAFLSAFGGLLIQFPITIVTQMAENSRSFPGAAIYFFSFFTILTNTLVSAVTASRLFPGINLLAFFRRPVVGVTALASILIVMIVYHFMLSADHNPAGVEAFANLMLHYVGPILFAVWWFAGARSGKTRWADLPKLLIYPIIYLLYTYIRSPLIGEYPYDFLDLNLNGVSGVATIVGGIIILFLIFGSIAIFYDQKSNRS